MTLVTSDKEFVAVGAAVGAGCQPCTRYHTEAALKTGISADDVLRAIEEAQAVRAEGGAAVAGVGRRVLGTDGVESADLEPARSRGVALARIGAAVGCNSGVLLARYAGEAAASGVDSGGLREAVDIAGMVKEQAGKFLLRDIERVTGVAAGAVPEAEGAPATRCC